MTMLKTLSLILAIVIMVGAACVGPKAKPAKICGRIYAIIGIATVALGTLNVPVYPAEIPLPMWVMGAVLLVLAAAPPLLGLLENRVKRPRIAFGRGRFLGHIATNLLGGLLATGTILMSRRVSSMVDSSIAFTNDDLFNVFLPLCASVVLYFVYSQQEKQAEPDSEHKSPRSGVQNRYENSLSRWHQLANVIFLIAVTVSTLSSFVCVFAISMIHAREGNRLPFTWETAIVISAVLIFVLVCGFPGVRDDRSVYMTFLTGTPAVLCVAILWTTFFRDSTLRDAFIYIATTVSYVVYVTLVILELRARGERPRMHFFAPLAFALLLAILMFGVYLG